MAVKKSVEITWNGTSYMVPISMGLINQIEEHINLMIMMQNSMTGDIRFSQASLLISMLLTEGGCKITQDEVWQAMFGAGEMGAEEVAPLLFEIWSAIFPEPPKKSKPLRAAKSKNR